MQNVEQVDQAEDTNLTIFVVQYNLIYIAPLFCFYLGGMIMKLYELKNGKLLNIKISSNNQSAEAPVIEWDKLVLIPIEDYVFIANSFTNKYLIVENNLLSDDRIIKILKDNKYLETPNKENMGYFKDLVLKDNKFEKFISFILAPSYACNLNCPYCYQQHDKTLNKMKISAENEENFYKVVEEVMNWGKDKGLHFDMGLFGGEPLLIQNEHIINNMFEFCRRKKMKVDITTNGTNIKYFLKKLVLYRNIISTIYTTVDSIEYNEITRHSILSLEESNADNILADVKILLKYGVNVTVASNIDSSNIDSMFNTYKYLKDNGYFEFKNFNWQIGRVDDRLYETGYDKIISEGEILSQFIKIKEESRKDNIENITPAFIKTSYNISKALGLDIEQKETRGEYSYCWNNSNKDRVFYVDNNLDTYRCTYTVGRPKHKIFKFSIDNVKENIVNESYFSYLSEDKCKNCKIGGFCSGGCSLSRRVDFDKFCRNELEYFDDFCNKVLTPELKKIVSNTNYF